MYKSLCRVIFADNASRNLVDVISAQAIRACYHALLFPDPLDIKASLSINTFNIAS